MNTNQNTTKFPHIVKETKQGYFAIIENGAVVGQNCKISHFCHISKGVTIGDNVIIMPHVYIPPGVQIKNNVYIGQNVTFVDTIAKRARYHGYSEASIVIEEGATISAGCTIAGKVQIGKNAFIAPASVIIDQNIPSSTYIAATYKMIMGKACICGQKLKGCTPCSCKNLH